MSPILPSGEYMETERIAKLEIQVDTIKSDLREVKSDIKEIHSRITTGNREIVDKMDDMQTRIEHKMNAQSIASTQQHLEIQKEIRKDVEQMEVRVTALEQWKWYVIGGSAAAGFIISFLFK